MASVSLVCFRCVFVMTFAICTLSEKRENLWNVFATCGVAEN